jgi:hypothetical protein
MSRKIPFLFATGYNSEDINPAYGHAFSISKPFAFDKLEVRLSALLGHLPTESNGSSTAADLT